MPIVRYIAECEVVRNDCTQKTRVKTGLIGTTLPVSIDGFQTNFLA